MIKLLKLIETQNGSQSEQLVREYSFLRPKSKYDYHMLSKNTFYGDVLNNILTSLFVFGPKGKFSAAMLINILSGIKENKKIEHERTSSQFR